MNPTPGQLSQRAYEAVISGNPDAATLTEQAAKAYADEQNETEPPLSSEHYESEQNARFAA